MHFSAVRLRATQKPIWAPGKSTFTCQRYHKKEEMPEGKRERERERGSEAGEEKKKKYPSLRLFTTDGPQARQSRNSRRPKEGRMNGMTTRSASAEY